MLKNNEIQNIDCLFEIPSLIALFASNNKINGHIYLNESTHLINVNLSNNKIAELRINGTIKSLMRLDLSANLFTKFGGFQPTREYMGS